MTMPRWIPIVVASTGALLACGRGPAREKTARPVRVEIVRKEAAGGGLRYSATIQPNEQVPLAFKVGGYVREVLQRPGVGGRMRDLQQGDAVAKGTVLARITESDYQEKVNQAKAQVAEAEAGLAKARADAERAEGLYQSHSLTRPDYDAARASRDAAQAKADGARAQLEAAAIALRDCALVAPADMVVLSRNVEVGTLAAAGTVGFVLADLTRVKAVFGVPDTLVERVEAGASLSVTSDAFGDQRFPGRISAVSPSADAQSRVFTVEVTIPNPRRQLKAGMIATVEVPSAASPELAPGLPSVDVAAIVKSARTAGGYAVFLAEGEGERATARAVDVSLGTITGNRVAVTTGLSAGERVIVTGASLLTNGDPVRVIPGEGR
jgi:RND family efflux transporter MFP subunit